MIKWWKNRQIKKRLFHNEAQYKRHIRHLSAQNRGLYIGYINGIRKFLLKKNDKEVENRQKWLKAADLNPPQTVAECEQMVKDLEAFHA